MHLVLVRCLLEVIGWIWWWKGLNLVSIITNKQTHWNASGVASPLLLEVWMVEIMLGHLLCSKYIFLWSGMESTRSKSWIVTFNRGAECVPPRGLLRHQPWHCLWLPSGWLGIGCAFSSRLRWSRPWVPVHWSGNFFLDDNSPDVTWLFMYTPQPSSDTSTYRWWVAVNGNKEIPYSTGFCHHWNFGWTLSGRCNINHDLSMMMQGDVFTVMSGTEVRSPRSEWERSWWHVIGTWNVSPLEDLYPISWYVQIKR